MDSERFDALTCSFFLGSSRRSALALTLAGLLGSISIAPVAAKKK